MRVWYAAHFSRRQMLDFDVSQREVYCDVSVFKCLPLSVANVIKWHIHFNPAKYQLVNMLNMAARPKLEPLRSGLAFSMAQCSTMPYPVWHSPPHVCKAQSCCGKHYRIKGDNRPGRKVFFLLVYGALLSHKLQLKLGVSREIVFLIGAIWVKYIFHGDNLAGVCK